MSITISIVEDHRDTREKLVELLSVEPKLKHISSFSNAEEAIRRIPHDKPDVALVDINLPGMSGIQCVAKLKEKMPTLQVLILTAYNESKLIFSSLQAGASGYLLKKSLSDELISAIEQVHAGGAPMSMQIARKVVCHFQKTKPNSTMEALTPREQDILSHLASGYRYKEISDRLGISFNTVRTHLRNIYEKLHVQSRTEATVKYLEQK